jgi:hypothetical protein
MFASCGWFWDDPVRPETAGALRTAVRAARLVDRLHDSGLERRLLDDLALVRDPNGRDGVSIARSALEIVGQRVA